MINVATFWNNKKRLVFTKNWTGIHTEPQILPHIRIQIFATDGTSSCKGLHLICNKNSLICPWFLCFSSLYAINWRKNTSLINVKPSIYYKGFGNFISKLCLLATKIYSSASLSASLLLISLSPQDDELITKSGSSFRWPFL